MANDLCRIAVAFPLPFYAPLWVARSIGAFTREGLDPVISVPAPGRTVDLIERGEADLALSGVMRSFVLWDRERRRLPAIAEVNSRDGFLLLARAPAPGFSWRDLEGKRLVLFGEAPTPWMCLQATLRRHGVDPARVVVVRDLPVHDAIRTLREGGADYLQTGQPMADELTAAGQAHLACAMADAVGHVPYSSIIVTPAVLDARPEFCARAVRALTGALRWMARTGADEIADAIAPVFPAIAPPILRGVVARYQAAGTWSAGPLQAREPFERLGRMLQEGGLIRTAGPYAALVDNRFAEAAAG